MRHEAEKKYYSSTTEIQIESRRLDRCIEFGYPRDVERMLSKETNGERSELTES